MSSKSLHSLETNILTKPITQTKFNTESSFMAQAGKSKRTSETKTLKSSLKSGKTGSVGHKMCVVKEHPVKSLRKQ